MATDNLVTITPTKPFLILIVFYLPLSLNYCYCSVFSDNERHVLLVRLLANLKF